MINFILHVKAKDLDDLSRPIILAANGESFIGFAKEHVIKIRTFVTVRPSSFAKFAKFHESFVSSNSTIAARCRESAIGGNIVRRNRWVLLRKNPQKHRVRLQLTLVRASRPRPLRPQRKSRSLQECPRQTSQVGTRLVYQSDRQAVEALQVLKLSKLARSPKHSSAAHQAVPSSSDGKAALLALSWVR